MKDAAYTGGWNRKRQRGKKSHTNLGEKREKANGRRNSREDISLKRIP